MENPTGLRRKRSVSTLLGIKRGPSGESSSTSSSGGIQIGIRRSSTGNGNTTTTTPHFSSDVAARSYLARQRPHSAKRSLPDKSDGSLLRLVCTIAGGDCGFEAIAWGIAITQGNGPNCRQVRRILAQHVYSNRDVYIQACGNANQVDEFCHNVLKTGLLGHWLGACWGALEIVAVARALHITIRVYTFDVRSQKFRCYFEEVAGPADQPPVRLLFTGDADRGHFDCLIPEAKSILPALWRRRFVRKLQVVAPVVA